MQTKNMFAKILSAVSGAIFIITLAGCSSNISIQQSDENCAQVAGTWIVEDVIDDSQCGGQGKYLKYHYTVSQNNCQVSIAESGAVGKISGSKIHWPAYSLSIHGGTTSFPETTTTTEIRGGKLTSLSHWHWSNADLECSGSSKITAYLSSKNDTEENINSQYSSLLSPKEGAFELIFSVHAPDAQEVYLAGEMTDWQGDRLKMKKGKNGTWFLPLYLQQGAWQYKFVIDGEWIHDKANPATTDDGFDGYNSIIVLGQESLGSQINANIPHGSLEKINIASEVLGANSPFIVYLPAEYAENKNKHYPVLYLLHGYGNNEAQWIRDGKIQNFMDNYINENWIQPFIIVMPFGDTSMYVQEYETHIIKEIRDYVNNHYRVKVGKASTAISGMSMGGFGAFYLAHRYQDLFGLSVPLSGYFDMNYYPELGKNGKITMNSELHFYCGKDDTTSFISNEALIKKLRENNVDFSYKVTAGGHTWRYWNGISKEFLKVVSEYFSKS